VNQSTPDPRPTEADTIIRVALQESQRLFRDGLEMFLAAEPDIEVVAAAADPTALLAICERHRPDVVVLQVDRVTWDVARLAGGIQRRLRNVRIIGLYDRITRDEAVRHRRDGIRPLLARANGITSIVNAIRGIEGPATEPLAGPQGARVAGAATLTARELQVLELVSGGLTTREISVELGISPKTVENHKQRSFQKLGVQNQAHAVAVAMRRGLLMPRR
jgi:DNA-binding NarL/FixJ family response regulator